MGLMITTSQDKISPHVFFLLLGLLLAFSLLASLVCYLFHGRNLVSRLSMAIMMEETIPHTFSSVAFLWFSLFCFVWYFFQSQGLLMALEVVLFLSLQPDSNR